LRYRLDRTAQRLDGGRVLLGGSPLTLFRLAPGGQRVVDAIDRGEEIPASAQPLVERLVETGAAHPRPDGARSTPDDVTVVVPVHGHDPAPTIRALGPARAVVVVDDGNDPPLPPFEGTAVARHTVRRGPAAARMTGLEMVSTPLVAFVDADCVPRPGWLPALLGHFDDDRVGFAAPRVVSEPGAGALARYEVGRSPLDLGPDGARVAPGTRVGFVPGAALVVRVDALRAVGGFDETMPLGEDVDLVWRLVAAGWRGRYEPAALVAHRPRRSLAGFARQRAGYGRSATPLHHRHPGAVAPAVVGPWAAAGWALIAVGHPVAGFGLAAVPAGVLTRTLPALPERTGLASRLAAVGFVRAGQQLASVLTRIWWPAALAAAIVVRRLRPALAAAAVVPVLLDWFGEDEGRLDPVRYLGLRLLDDAAYGAGVWAGAWTGRDVGALLPRLTRRRASPNGRAIPARR
jgi:mycofactocin system glycosyltransferase